MNLYLIETLSELKVLIYTPCPTIKATCFVNYSVYTVPREACVVFI